MRAVTCIQAFKGNEEIFAGQLVAKQHASQRTPGPVVANPERRVQNDFVGRRAEGAFGVVDVVRLGVLLPNATCEVVQKIASACCGTCVRLRAFAILEHERGLEPVVHQVHQDVFGVSAGRHVGGELHLARKRGPLQ